MKSYARGRGSSLATETSHVSPSTKHHASSIKHPASSIEHPAARLWAGLKVAHAVEIALTRSRYSCFCPTFPNRPDQSSIMGLTGLLAARGQEADANGDRARKLQRELDSTRRDAEGMLQVDYNRGGVQLKQSLASVEVVSTFVVGRKAHV